MYILEVGDERGKNRKYAIFSKIEKVQVKILEISSQFFLIFIFCQVLHTSTVSQTWIAFEIRGSAVRTFTCICSEPRTTADDHYKGFHVYGL